MIDREPATARADLVRAARGGDTDAFAALVRAEYRRDAPRTVEVNAWAEVPYEDVVRVVDLARAAGTAKITFVGAPPPK